MLSHRQCYPSSPVPGLSDILLLLLSHFSLVRLCVTPCPWGSPSKNTGVACHFLRQFMKVKSESEVAQSCLTLRNPMDCSLPGSSVHGIFQARVLEWVAIAFSLGYPRRIQLAWPDILSKGRDLMNPCQVLSFHGRKVLRN